MKKMIISWITLIGFCIISTSCIIYTGSRRSGNSPALRGNREIIVSERNVSSFKNIRIGLNDISGNGSNNVILSFHLSVEYRVVIAADSNLMEYIEINENSDRLEIRTKREGVNYLFTKFTVDVYSPRVEDVSIDIAGSGEIEGDIECDNLSIDISGYGNITLEGTAKNTDIHISGYGRFNKSGFKTNNATVGINGSGDINIWVTDYLKARINGSGTIKYRGNPGVDTRISGSGNIEAESTDI